MVQNWEPGTQYQYGDAVLFEGHKYKIIQPHRSQSDWIPSVAPALWGRVPDDHNAQQQCQPSQQQYQPPQHQPYPSSPQSNTEQKPFINQTPPSGTQEHKNWWDENKKKVEIGGGLLAGAAAIGAGIYAKKKYEKNKEQAVSQDLARSQWLADAQLRTDEFHRNGPRGPVTWVLTNGKNIPRGAIMISNDPHSMYACRAFTDGTIQVGKASLAFQKGGVIGYKFDEIHVDQYEILLGDMRALRWVSAHGKLQLTDPRARPVEGGNERDGTPLYIARALYKGGVHPGKASPKLDGAFIPLDGKEKAVNEYEVLCYIS
ncbi:carbohydrate-binding module family 12 protein [Amanita muscaria Koide BX008]|uniref:Carbohydrate-binding module family 12 protein n=1 Tax=Amanita muscaria (strain Koide BX008) TaxID=946122 RepID=A0A0C2SZE0_AMAMK|nr:carbohydrate-binding module family 12 protein [Amanita muscaria Koide BX008]